MRIALCPTFLLFAASYAFSQVGPLVPNRDATAAALKGLATLPELVKEGNIKLYGLESVGQLSRSTLGTPISIYRVELDALKNYEPNNPDGLLIQSDQYLYPVKVGPVPVTSFTVEQTGKGWQATRFGDAVLSRDLAQAISKSAAANQISPDQYFLVWIQAMNRYFAAHRSDNQVFLMTIYDDTDLNLEAGTEKSADEWFKALKAVAPKYENPN